MDKRILFLFLLIVAVMIGFMAFAGADKTIISINSDTGLIVETTNPSYIRTGEDHEFETHVFNRSTGMPVNAGIDCYFHLYHKVGNHHAVGSDSVPSHTFDYAWDVNGTNFTGRGEYQLKVQCNNSLIGGGEELFFWVNDYGEELTDANSSNFNFSMAFLMILFLGALIGCIKAENYIVKFVLYWVCHLLFVIGTFSVWTFHQGYAMAYLGFAGIWKIMFYVSITAVLPMVILSMVWVFYIHLFNDHFQKLIDKGNDTETAFAMAKKKSGGWFGGGK